MPDVTLHRPHQLGLAQARDVARHWMADAQTQWGLTCAWLPDEDGDTVAFNRAGVQGRMTVAADHFALEATLGFLFKAFAPRIQQEIEQQLDQVLTAAEHGQRTDDA